MKPENIVITHGENTYQNAEFEIKDKILDYSVSKQLAYSDILNITAGLNLISEFFDVNAAVSVSLSGICAAALGKTPEDAFLKIMDSNPIDFLNSIILMTCKVDSETAMKLKPSNKIAAPEFTPNAKEYLESHDICYITINTPLKDYKKYLMPSTTVTPLGTLTQSPNFSELNKDLFKVVTKVKPAVEQIEDAVFAWKTAKHVRSQAIVIAKDLKTSAVLNGLNTSSVELALDYSCDMSKEAVIASDLPLTLHDVRAAAQGRIGLIIVPEADKEIIDCADKYNIAVITTGITNILL